MRIVYSPLDAVRIAAENPSRQAVFFAVGFETTAPANAMAVHQARRLGLENFSILVSHVLVPPAMEAVLSSPSNRVQAFLAAGHVCTVMGFEEYEPIAARFRVPIVVTGFESSIESDTAPLNGVVDALLSSGIEVPALRDLTRGGLATCLVEIAESRGVRIDFDESAVPVREDVGGACEMLGFDPLYVANEGRLIAIVPPEQADQAVAAMRARPEAADSRVIGRVGAEGPPSVVLRSRIGASRLVDMLSGEQLPRIC